MIKEPTISIIGGKGKMGQLFASFFREHGIKVLISDKGTKLTNRQAAELCDIVIVAVSMGKAVDIIKAISKYVKSDALLTDITSVKEMPMKAMEASKGEFVGMHPMFGSSNPIPGQMIIWCEGRVGKWSKWLKEFFKTRGVNICKMNPKEHDEMMSYVQGIIHFADIVFAHAIMKTGKRMKDFLPFASPASDIKVMLAGRLINQDEHLYGNIQMLNKNNKKLLSQFLKSTSDLEKIVRDGDLKKFKEYFKESKIFWGRYGEKSYKESSELIDALLLKRRREKLSKKSIQGLKGSSGDIAVLGPIGTYTDLAASQYDKALKKAYKGTIDAVFEDVAKGRVSLGIVPIENKLQGTVRESLDNLFVQNVRVVDELNLPIKHCLMTLAHAKQSQIRSVISHSQALNQCSKYIKKNFPNAETEAHSSTAAAMAKLILSQDASIAVIGPEETALANNLKILDHNIGDKKDNSTRFIVIKKGSIGLSRSLKTHTSKTTKDFKHGKSSIAFYFSANSPGSLFSVFKDFADAKVNMNKIESRPTAKKFGEYIFYLDFDGHISEKKIMALLKKVERKVAKLKVLGSY